MANSTAQWHQHLHIVGCQSCGQLYLAPAQLVATNCPLCPNETLQEVESPTIYTEQLVEPELVVPYAVSAETVNKSIRDFANSYYFTPQDLTTHNLQARMQRILLPMYLVDSDVETEWQAEIGFDYQVVSHVEQYQHGGWQSSEKKETRVRWEQRTGTLQRHYDNVRAPALEQHAEIVTVLGKFQTWQTEPFVPDHAADSLIQLPDREQADAWSDAEPLLLQRVEKECMQASKGQHIRQFKWQPTITNKHWTTLLLPTFTTYYLDDQGERIPIIIHGRNGNVTGEKIGSSQLAKRTSLALGIAALICFVIYLVGYFTTTAGIAPLFLLFALILGLSTLYPFYYVNKLNNKSPLNSPRRR
ncbi:MAG TPA: hypothetical protein ENJ56_06645 [Anaerolineae bacterium]|nr:hypothetical protein [Anaerolineae bacterium]